MPESTNFPLWVQNWLILGTQINRAPVLVQAIETETNYQGETGIVVLNCCTSYTIVFSRQAGRNLLPHLMLRTPYVIFGTCINLRRPFQGTFPATNNKKYFTLSRAVGIEKESNGIIFSKRSDFRKDFLTLEESHEQYRKSEKAESRLHCFDCLLSTENSSKHEAFKPFCAQSSPVLNHL